MENNKTSKLWIARDEDNTLKLHFTGPYRHCDHYNSCGTVDENGPYFIHAYIKCPYCNDNISWQPI